jgi:hypothetical protein
MDWLEFLEDVATECVLEDLQRSAFIARFESGNSGKTDTQIALGTKDELGSLVFAGQAAFTKLMTAVYGKVAVRWPELAELKKGKKTRLAALLRAEFQRRQAGVVESPIQPKPAPAAQSKVGLKPGAPMPQLRLPDNFVARPDALAAVKEKLLRESGQTLVVSAISGLGGLGKSVLATALVLDAEVQGRFEDGILWITLGQNPDLQNCLGDWIRALDKSRDSFSATTLESAKGYLHNLLAERRMLLVVDDVWNSDEAEWFRVGGAGCRVLVTTRKEEIEGADCYSLDLMTEAEAIELVQRKLGKKWRFSGGETTSTADEAAFLGFAKSLGYLPLALDLAANLVRDGVGWGELRAEFEAERRDVALGLLDSTADDWERLPEEQRRKYSLQACFNLSLNRLNELQRSQFGWLGVLPVTVNLTVATGRVLWDLSSVHTKRVLKMLRSRSLLMDGPETMDGERSYRVHDLMHDMARGLIEKGEVGVENMVGAHRSFLERYRGLCGDGRWWKPPYDREKPYEYLYFYRHLTWHLEMADWADEVHDLMAASDELGRNAWFEDCDKIGQHAIFVEDVARGWRLAEKLYEKDRERAIVLQFRYALITGTLNSLVGNLSDRLLAAFVRDKIWTIEQAWVYVDQMEENSNLIAGAIESLSPYLTRNLIQSAINKIDRICDRTDRLAPLVQLAKNDTSRLPEILEEAQNCHDTFSQAVILVELSKSDHKFILKLEDVMLSIKDNYKLFLILVELLKFDNSITSKILETIELIQDPLEKAWASTILSETNNEYFLRALEAAKNIRDRHGLIDIISHLIKTNPSHHSELLDLVPEKVENSYDYAWILSSLAIVDREYLQEALQVTQTIAEPFERSIIISQLTEVPEINHLDLLHMARAIRDEYSQTKALIELAKVNNEFISIAVKTARRIENEYDRAQAFRKITLIDSQHFEEALKSAIQMKENFKINFFRESESEFLYAELLKDLTSIDTIYYPQLNTKFIF